MTETEEESLPDEESEGVSASQIELEQLRDYKDKYVRLLAESENARKRFQRDRQDSVRHAVADVIVEFLSPLDHLENALKFADQATPEVRNWAVGFEMILTQFKDALASHGVFGFDSEGQPFDPHLHDAFETVETDEHPPNTVIEETVRGYKMGEHTLRPARVKVSKTQQPEEQPDHEQEKQ